MADEIQVDIEELDQEAAKAAAKARANGAADPELGENGERKGAPEIITPEIGQGCMKEKS